MKKQFISWRRVSTFRQSKSGLGLEAQKEIIRYFVERDNGELVADYSECYTGKELSGCKELRKAMQHAKNIGAVLVIAKSDRFRNCQEALGILDEMGEGHLEFCDLPHSDRFTLTLFWALAEREALITSIRTKQALAVKKARGCKLGAGNEKYKAKIAAKPENELKADYIKRGKSKTSRYLDSKEVQAFVRVLRACYPEGHEEDVRMWTNWRGINTCRDNRLRILRMMRDYKELCGGEVFKDMDLTDMEAPRLQIQLAHKIHTLKTSVRNYSVYAGIDDADIKGITAEQQDMDMAV